MTQTQSGLDIGEAVQRIHQQFAVDRELLKRGGHNFSADPSRIESLQTALNNAGQVARVGTVRSEQDGHLYPFTHVSGAYRRTHLVVVSGGVVFDPYCDHPVSRNSYLQEIYGHQGNPPVELIVH
jgi:hypothetical protein